MRHRERWATVALAIAALGRAAAAEDNVVYGEEPAQIYVPELRSAPRKLIGFDFGLGIYDAFCEGCRVTGGLSVGFSAGIQLTDRIAAIGDIWSLLHLLPVDEPRERGLTVDTLAIAAARFWIRPTLWVQAGAGAGFLAITGARGDDIIFGPSACIAVGSELKHRPGSGIDVSLRIGSTWFLPDDPEMSTVADELLYSIAAGVGYHWN